MVTTPKAKSIKPWHLGNTTLRNPYRLQDGLKHLAESPFLGNLDGKPNQEAFARYLDAAGIVDLKRGKKDVSDLGRKWRSAFAQLGLITAKLKSKHGDQAWVGQPDLITPNGRRLMEAASGPATQEVILRALAAYCIPSPIEPAYEFERFNPLRHVIRLIQTLRDAGEEAKLTALEMGAIVPFTNSSDDLNVVVEQISALRKARETSTRKRRFDGDIYDELAAKHGYARDTFSAYADVNRRYLKATGLFTSSGRGIAIAPEKAKLAELLAQDSGVIADDKLYVEQVMKGGALPTDDVNLGKDYLDSLIKIASDRGLTVPTEGRSLATAADISSVAHDIEAIILEDKEVDFAAEQAKQWQEIVHYMTAIITGKKLDLGEVDGEKRQTDVRKEDRAVYLEWVLWRAFLAINSLVNRPNQARRFSVDQDFLPISCAPGGGPDMIFEFDDFVVVCEVTLTTSSRQEAAEGEPVRRHVADVAERYGEAKPVYGLFIALRIDSNTAETFRIGTWYVNDTNKTTLNVVPVTLADFRNFFEAIFKTGKIDTAHVRELLDACCAERAPTGGAPEWKKAIETHVADRIARMSG